MKSYTAVMLTPKNAIVERQVRAANLATASALAITLNRGDLLAICED